jgi:hypothetical protein
VLERYVAELRGDRPFTSIAALTSGYQEVLRRRPPMTPARTAALKALDRKPCLFAMVLPLPPRCFTH